MRNEMNDLNFVECPNCGGSDFIEIGPRKQKCAYCGTILTTRETESEPKSAPVTCPHCGFENGRGDLYCNSCGKPLVVWSRPPSKKRDLAAISLIVTVVSIFFVPVPIVGPGLGLYLGYKALKEARSGGRAQGSEKLARVAIAVAWVAMLLPVCALSASAGVHTARSIYEWLRTLFHFLLAGS